MPTTYRIHPGIGIARLGNSPDAFCISPEKPAALPIDCDSRGNPLLSPDGMTELIVTAFKDAQGRMKRQAARFQVWAYDDEHPHGRPLKLGDQIEGGGNAGTLIDIHWRVYLGNKKSSWYQFEQLEGEHGYEPNHPRRNASITDPNARQQLIIDPGPRTVDHRQKRTAHFDRDSDYACTFPPALQPNSIDTLGDLLTDDTGRLLVLGGHGNSGSFLYDDFGQPRIDDYANNDGWFDDTSDGPVMARLAMYSPLVGRVRYIDVEFPAWVVCCYPAYVPEILDVVTMDDVVEDMAIRKFAERTDLYGTSGTFGNPQHIPPTDEPALVHWRAGRLQWNDNYKPWFYRDIWTILYRPDRYDYLCDTLSQSNFPHNQSTRGTFDYEKLSCPPVINQKAVEACERRCVQRHYSGELFVEELSAELASLEPMFTGSPGQQLVLDEKRSDKLLKAVSDFAHNLIDQKATEDADHYLDKWLSASESAADAKEELKHRVDKILRADSDYPEHFTDLFSRRTHEHLQKYLSGQLLRNCWRKCIKANTYDPYGPMRRYLFDLLRAPGEENQFMIKGRPDSRVHNLPRMPLLCGDNPINNVLPSKFLRLTDYQYYLLRQWAYGWFYNEKFEGWADPDPIQPYSDWVNHSGRDVDRGVLSNVLGGAFCPGGEIGWVMRNPSIWVQPYRIKADPAFYNFGQTAAQASTSAGQQPDENYAFYAGDDLSQDNDFETGLQPGDLTKYMSVPWQADFNECSLQNIDITYELFNQIYPGSDHDERMEREQKVWQTLWWPAHRPMQTFEPAVGPDGTVSFRWIDWTPGIPQTNAGDLRMVTEWWRLSVVRSNPTGNFQPSTLGMDSDNPPYISVERTKRTE
jgi:hypothetical protein